jgi:hypothetical protein
VPIGAGENQRQRDAAAIHQLMALGPLLAPGRRVAPDGPLGQGRLDHGRIDTLPLPGNAGQFVIVSQAAPPQGREHPRLLPALEIAVDRTAAAQAARHRLPVAAGAQHGDDPCEHAARRQRFASSTWLASINLGRVTFRNRDQRLHA